MAAYLIAEHIITDAAKFEEYRTKVAPMMAKHGGRYLTKGGTHKLPEGGHWTPERVVIIEFPDMKIPSMRGTNPRSTNPSLPFAKPAPAIPICCLLLRVCDFARGNSAILPRVQSGLSLNPAQWSPGKLAWSGRQWSAS